MEGVVGVLLLKRVIDVIKTDQKVLDRALSHTMSWTLDGDEPTEEDQIARIIILYDQSYKLWENATKVPISPSYNSIHLIILLHTVRTEYLKLMHRGGRS